MNDQNTAPTSQDTLAYLDGEQQARAAAFSIAAEAASHVAEHLVLESRNGDFKGPPKGGLRAAWSIVVDGETPEGSTTFYDTKQSTFADVTMRFAQWIELGFDTENIDEEDEA